MGASSMVIRRLRRAWEEFVLPQIDAFDRDHYETVWSAVVRKGPKGPVFE